MVARISSVRRGVNLQRCFAALALGYMFVASGCTGRVAAPKTVSVKGTVIFRDKPLAKAKVTFYAKGSSLAPSAVTNEQGQFELGAAGKGNGAAPGPNVVTVTLVDEAAAGPTAADPAAVLKGGGTPLVKSELATDSSTPARNATHIPSEYGAAAKSPLKVTIGEKGESDMKIELK